MQRRVPAGSNISCNKYFQGGWWPLTAARNTKAPPSLLVTNGGMKARLVKVANSKRVPSADYLSVSGKVDTCRQTRRVSGGLDNASGDALLNHIEQGRAVSSDLIDRQPFK